MNFKQQLTNVSTVLNNASDATKLLMSFNALDSAQQKVLLSSKLLTEEQKQQCITMSALSSANASYTAEQLTKATGISSETLATWGLTEATDSLTLSQLAEIASSDAQAKVVLEKIVAQNANAVANGEVTASNIVLATSEKGTTLATGAFTTAIKANILAMKTWLLTTPAGWLTMIAGGIFLAVKAYDSLTVSIKEQKEKMKDSLSAYEDTKSKLSNITTELKTQEQAMENLLKKDKLTYTEKGQLEELQAITRELRTQKDLAEKEEGRKKKDVATEASDLFKKQFGGYDISESAIDEYQNNADITGNNAILVSDTNDISAMIAGYKQFNELLDEAYGEQNQEDIDYFKSLTDELSDNIFSTAQDLQNQQDSISDYYNTIKETPYEDLTQDQKEIVDSYNAISDAIALIYKQLDPNTWNTMQIDNLFETEGIEKTKEELIEMANFAKISPDIIKKSFPVLNKELSETDMFLEKGQTSAEAFCDEINSLADEYEKGMDSVKSKPSLEQLLNTGELSDIKDELYDLSRSGKLDKDTLESTERYAELLSLTGMEAEDAVEQIEKLAQASDDLSKMSSFVDGLDELSKAYELFQDGEIIDSSTLSSIQNVFGSGTEEFQKFKDAVMNGSGDIQTAFNDLANSYLDTTGALDGLTEANKKHYIEELKNNGIVNANAVVESRLSGVQKQRTAIIDALNSCNSSLNKTNANLVITTNNLEKATWQEIAALIEESGQSKNTAQALAVYALKKALANAEQIHEEESISQIKMLAETAGIASTIVTAYINAKNGNIKDSEAAQKIISEYQEKLNSVESKYKGTKAVVAPVVTSYSPDVGDDDKDSKDSLSEFNQMINWCEQSINKLSNAISLLNAKLDNTTSYKKRSSLLSKLINKQNQLTNAYEKTANVYSEKYSNALSKLSKSDRAKVQNESYSIEQFYAETESGEISTTEKRYNNIKDALEWRDSLAEIREQYVSSTKQMNDYAEQLADIPWDEAESKVEKLNDKIDLLDSKLNNTNGYTKKNKILNQQLSLQKQIVAQYEKALKTENDQLSQYKKSLKTTYSKDGNDILSKINKKYKQKSDYNSDGTLKVDKKASKQQQQLIKEYNTSISKLNAISKNNKLSTTGLTGDVLELALKYNATLEEIRTNTTQLAQEQEELKTQSTENIMTQIENIQSDYDRYSSIRDAQINEINNKMDLAEANGRLLGTSYYTELMRIENEDMKKTIEEKNKLMSKINEIEPYTDEWYEMKLAIYECDDEIRQATISIQEYQNTIDELDWSNFERLQGLLDNLIEESDFLINVLSNKKSTNDNGLTNEGLASLGLHAVNYDTYMSQAEEYKNKINELNKKIEEDPYNTNYINQRNEYLKLQQECIESALSEKQSIIELATDGLTAEQEALEETINKKKELLKTEEDLYSFRKKIKEQTKIIADLEKQINALQGDDSEENRKKLQELKADLADARSDLEDTMHNQSVGDLETDLDDMLNTSKTKLEEYLEDSEQVFIDALTKVNNNTGIIAETIKSTAKEVGYTISNELASSWNTAGQAVTAYNNTFVNVSSGIITSINGIKSAWEDALKAYENYASISVTASQNKESQYATNGASTDDIWDFINDNKDKATHEKSYYLDTNQYIYEKTGGYVLTKANELNLAKLLGMDTTGVTASNISNAFRNSILDKLKNAGFTTGGYIDAIKRTGEDGVALVRHGEAVLTVEQSKQFKKLTENLKPLNEIIKLSSDNIKLPNYTPSSIYEINNNFKIDGIATNEVVDQMGTIVSKEVEKSITKINQQNYAKGVRRKL